MAAIDDILAKLAADPELAMRMNAQMADSEFQAAIAPNLGYQGPIDPSVARWHPLPTTRPTNLMGFEVPEDISDPGSYSYGTGKGRIEVPQEPGTVNAVNVHATPLIWAHEYRHKQYPGLSERGNRIMDGYYAQDESDWQEAVNLWKEYKRDVLNKNLSQEEAERDLISQIETSPADQRRRFSAVRKEYERQNSGEQAIVGEDQITTGSKLWDIITHKADEFAAGRKRGQYWYKAKQRLENGDTIEHAVNQGIEEAKQ